MRATTIRDEWQFEKEVVCFNCQTKATQVVRIKDRKGSVICSACGAQRHYVIRSVIYGTDTPPMLPVGMKYDVWAFAKTSECLNCKEASRHGVHLDEYKMNIICDECGFSQVLKLDYLVLPPS
jgi:transcription elongation factor Elf1